MKKYLITSKDFYTQDPEVFRKTLQAQLSKHLPDFALYRDKDNKNYKELAMIFLEVCSEFKNLKAFVHGDYKLAFTSHARGVHLTSNMFDDIAKAKALGLEVIISTHTHEEVFEAEKLGADYVTYSPIYFTPHKGEPKGLDDLKNLLKLTNIKIFALGGIIDQKQVSEIEKISPFGFASIRFYY
jgi:thiamine-phosphate pyrophosphorylase